MSKGFTFLELIMVTAISLIVTGIVIGSFRNATDAQTLDTAVQVILSAFDRARSSTLASHGGTQYGVALASTSVTVFQGASYIPTSTTNEVSTFGTGIVISGTTLTSGATTTVFERLTGKTNRSGTITVTGGGQSRTITLYGTGVAE